MKITLSESQYLKDSISIISELVNEAEIKATNNGLELIAMDHANVAMVDFRLLPSLFSEYVLEKDTSFGINLERLKKVLSRAKPNDILKLELTQNKLKLQMKSDSTRNFDLPLMDNSEEKEQKIPDLKFGATVEMGSAALTDAVGDAEIAGESLTFTAESPNKFKVVAEDDNSKAEINMSISDSDIKIDEKSKSKYAIEYLKKMTPASRLAEKVKMSFKNDYPLKLEYTSVDKLQLSFILAPRIEDD